MKPKLQQNITLHLSGQSLSKEEKIASIDKNVEKNGTL
jgi:hypothetical protein